MYRRFRKKVFVRCASIFHCVNFATRLRSGVRIYREICAPIRFALRINRGESDDGVRAR